MLVFYFRSSSYTSYDYCQMKYFINYNLGYSEPTSIKANAGTIVHKVLECLATCKKFMQDNPKKRKFSTPDAEIGQLDFTKKALYSEEFVYHLLDRCFKYYTEADPANEYGDKWYEFCDEMVQAALIHNDGQFDPRNRKIIATEPRFDIEIDEPWAKFEHEGETYTLAIKGTIDLVTEESGIIEVIDWKTGLRKDWATGDTKTYEKLCNDPQLLLYHYAVLKLFPQYASAVMSIFFLRDGGPFTLCFDETDKEKFMGMLKARYFEVLENNSPQPINQARKDFRCFRLCHFFKNKWPGTNKRICNYVEDHIKVHGIELTSEQLVKEGHTLNKYKAPGEIET